VIASYRHFHTEVHMSPVIYTWEFWSVYGCHHWLWNEKS